MNRTDNFQQLRVFLKITDIMIHNLSSEIRPRWQIWAPWCLWEDKGWSLCLCLFYSYFFDGMCCKHVWKETPVTTEWVRNLCDVPLSISPGSCRLFLKSGDGTLTLSEVPWRHILSLMSRPRRFFMDLLYQERTSKAFRRQDTIHLQWETQSGVLEAHPRPPFPPLRQHSFWLGPIRV